MNTKYKADVVIEPHGEMFNIWIDDAFHGMVTREVADLISAGSSACKMSVFDVEKNHFVCGTLDQLMDSSHAE